MKSNLFAYQKGNKVQNFAKRSSLQFTKFSSSKKLHKLRDHHTRGMFGEWSENKIPIRSYFQHKILFSDEAHYWLNGFVNKQNCPIWSE